RSSRASARPARAGCCCRYASTRTRSPRCQRRAWSCRSDSSDLAPPASAGAGPSVEPRWAGSAIVHLLHPQFLGDPVQGTGQALAQGLGTFAPPRGDLGPLAALGPLVRQGPLVRGEALAERLQQVAAGRLLARAGARRGRLGGRAVPGPQAARV